MSQGRELVNNMFWFDEWGLPIVLRGWLDDVWIYKTQTCIFFGYVYIYTHVWCVCVVSALNTLHSPFRPFPFPYCAYRRTTTKNSMTRASAMVFDYVINIFRSGAHSKLFFFLFFLSLSLPQKLSI